MKKNIPLNSDEIHNLPKGFNFTSPHPNRRQRRAFLNVYPNSTKLGAGSINKGTVYRSNKYNDNY